nr:maleylpyruvate isomerase N-terminal domain-containing protein [Allomuricauda sp.]
MQGQKIPIDTRPLFKPLDKKLIELLKSLEADDWNKQTVAKDWKVKDVVSHIIDTKLRTLSMQRDKYFGEKAPEINSYGDLVAFINKLNADWIQASKRFSPEVLIFLLESIGDSTADYYNSLDPWDEAIFAVDWAGESKSYNWMHLAREYTEYWHHQQQIRDAVGQQGIMTKTFFHPFMDTFFQALPHTFKDVEAEPGTLVEVHITSDIGGTWYLQKLEGDWQLVEKADNTHDAYVEIPFDVSWILFSKSLRPHEVMGKVKIEGRKELATKVLEMVSVIA